MISLNEVFRRQSERSRQMRRFFSAVCVLIFLSSGCQEKSAAHDKNAEAELLTSIRARLDAVARNDIAAWSQYVADDMLAPLPANGVTPKQAWIKTREHWPSAVKYYYGPLENIKVQMHGDTAVVTFRAKQYNDIGGQVTYFDSWQIETHIRRDNRWLLAAIADAPILPAPKIAKVNAKIHDGYVGEYEYAPGFVAKVVRVGDKLLHELPNAGTDQLLPESDSTFFIEGDNSSRTIFVRDATGRTTHYIYRELGATDRIVRKIK
jgi:ketosteroid isomerase-like protein